MATPKPPGQPPESFVGGEDAAILRLAAAFEEASGPAPAIETWIGDDAAVVQAPGGCLVLAVDTAVVGVHADLTVTSLDDFGFRALTTAVSDLAAMGARPAHALVSISLGPEVGIAGLDRVGAGLADASRRWGCPVVGGDLTTAGETVVSVTVTGTVEEGPGPMLRSGAAPGDHLFVTGPLGASAAGLRLLRDPLGSAEVGEAAKAVASAVSAHRRPLARLAEGTAARLAGARAAIDVSDGLSLDLHRLATASGVGFHLDEVPVAPAATLDEALGGGDDYELILATPDPDGLCEAFTSAGLRVPIELGHCVADPAVRTLGDAPLEPLGWQHRLGD